MPEITQGNWSFRDPGDDIPDGSVINGGNFSQLQPNTAILVGKTLTIRGGNWVNVQPDPAWTIEGGNWTQISRCAHLHPEWSSLSCVENCSHVINTDEVWIDGILVDTVCHYEDTIL